MVSLPIPHESGTIAFHALRHRGHDIGQLVSDLSRSRVRAKHLAHLDPDLDPTARPRRRGWLPCFGQDGAAQKHLAHQGIGPGDLFLFFGWFCDVVKRRGRYQYQCGARQRHVIFGSLRVGEVLRVGTHRIPSWLGDHPHAANDALPHNTIYAAADPRDGGVFQRFHPSLELTCPTSTRRSVWRLPGDFLPRSRPPLTYHGAPSRWTADGDFCRLQSVAKGQEFVLDLDQYPGVREWADALIVESRSR